MRRTALPRAPEALFGFSLLAAPAALAQDGAPDPRPMIGLVRHDEDWSRIDQVDPEQADYGDRFKWMPLDEAGRWRLNLGASSQWRLEGWNTFGLDDSIGQRTDDVFLLGRIRLHADLHHDSGFRAFAELKSAAAWDRELPGGDRPIDEDPFDLQEGFLEQRIGAKGEGSLTFRAGRQMLQYGAQRLISPLPWGNTLRAWDGVLARFERGPWTVDSFWQRFAPVNISSFNDSVDDELFGLYASRRDARGALELYAFARDRGPVQFNGTAGDERRWTLGGRLGRGPRPGQVDYDLELAAQRGDVGDQDIEAWMLGAELGYRFASGAQPRVRVGIELGSGDDEPGGEVGTFSAPFPLGHAYYGYLDAVGRENSIDLFVAGTWFVSPELRVDLALHRFLREDGSDFVYQVNGAPYAGTDAASDSTAIGSELDLVCSGRFGRHWAWQLGWAHFIPDTALEAGGFDDDSDLVYSQLIYAF